MQATMMLCGFIDLEELFYVKSTNDKWAIFKNEICDQVASHIPVVMKTTSDKPLGPIAQSKFNAGLN